MEGVSEFRERLKHSISAVSENSIPSAPPLSILSNVMVVLSYSTC
jgi:hypothetical protein